MQQLRPPGAGAELAGRRRLDAELLRRGLCGSRQQAQESIAAGRVLVGGVVADKPARLVAPADPLVISGLPAQFVGRGGHKLNSALDRFGIDVTAQRAVDAGSSTGGFTDCLLQRGAASVVAIDVGHGQIHERLRADSRVRVLERTNVRTADLVQLDEQPFDIIVADLSFISLRTVAGSLVGLGRPGASMVMLVKPQFEAGAQVVSRGKGIVRDPLVWARVMDQVIVAYGEAGSVAIAAMASPILGAAGNVEFLVHARIGAHASAELDLDTVVAEGLALVGGS